MRSLDVHKLHLRDGAKGAAFKLYAGMGQAIEISGGDPEIHAHLGDVYLAMGRPEDAKRQYQKGLQLDPTSDALTRKLAELR